MKKRHLLLILVLLLIGCLCKSSHRLLLSHWNRNTSESDKEILDLFLKDLILNNHFGYTLFGEKPISIAGYFSEQPLWNLIFFHNRPKFPIETAWAVWDSYAKNSFSKNYLLIRENNSRYPGLTAVTLVNKKRFLAAVEENKDLFETILGKDASGEKLLSKLLNKHTGLFELLKCDEALYGILLGYGKTNALAYKRRCELAPFAAPGGLFLEEPFTLHFPTPSPGFTSIQQEYVFLENRLIPVNQNQGLNLIAPLYFLALTGSEETPSLQLKYQKTQKSLSRIYSRGSFLDLTLEQLTYGSS